jgi:hypothetical protein
MNKLNLKIIILIILIIKFLGCNNLICISLNNDDSININNIKNHSFALADDSMFGRGNGQVGLKIAQKYIIEQLSKAVIDKNNIIIQTLPVIEINTLENSEFELKNNLGTKKLILNNEYYIHSTGLMSYFPNELDLVFVRYGIFAPEIDYNDYYGINVVGKTVVFFDGVPDEITSNELKTRYSQLEAKKRIATSRGAIACILIPINEIKNNNDWKIWKLDYDKPEYNLPFFTSNILTIILHPELTDLIFNFDKRYKEPKDYSNENSQLLNTKMTFKGRYRDRSFNISNIIYEIKSTNPKYDDEYLVITAHYDHLGVSKPIDNDSIYNGFYDNAIGVSVLLELSKILTEQRDILKRSVLCIFFAGEEIGLLGSRYFTKNPIVPLYKMIANINIDGVAFIDNFKNVIGVGANYSNLKEFLSDIALDNNLFLDTNYNKKEAFDAFYNSDQVAFAYAGVPSVLVLDGLEFKNVSKEYGIKRLIDYLDNYYHTPKDDINLDVNWNATLQYTQFLLDFIIKLNISEKVPEWYNNKFYLERLRTRAEKR